MYPLAMVRFFKEKSVARPGVWGLESLGRVRLEWERKKGKDSFPHFEAAHVQFILRRVMIVNDYTVGRPFV